MSVVRGPWIAINVPMPVRGPWSVDWLLALAKTVRGLETTGTKCGAVNRPTEFHCSFQKCYRTSTPIFDVAVDCSPAGEFLFDTEAHTEVHETRVLENVLRELAHGNHDAE